jgi:ribonuclease R
MSKRRLKNKKQKIEDKKQICSPLFDDLVIGRVIGHADGFGFLKPDVPDEDVFLSIREMRSLFHGDRAIVRIIGKDKRGRLEGKVVKILERNTKQVVGRLYQENGVNFLVPDNKKLHHYINIPQEFLSGAKPGQILVVQIIEQPTKHAQPIGKVVEIIGNHAAVGMYSEIAIRTFHLPVAWSESVQQEIQQFNTEVPLIDASNRKDLRDIPLVTIDGVDAKDFDDAVYCERTPKGWRLLVCIADVSAYVALDSALDIEALQRGTSVYFMDRVIPMLPEILSNGLCSINPGVDRLCMACELIINGEGRIIRSKFFPAIMRSHARLTYDQVSMMLATNADNVDFEHAALLPHLRQLQAVYKALNAARQTRGAIEFEMPEIKFYFDAQNKITQIAQLERNEAHCIIEECMLAANVAAARLLERKHIPALYRVHPVPKLEKFIELQAFLKELGLNLPNNDVLEAKDFAVLMNTIQSRPDRYLIQTVMLRSLTQATYSPNNIGHFGLAYPYYTHFTSPIRRYPDLVVHRIIKHILANGSATDFVYSLSKLRSIGEHCSVMERRADEAAWDVIARLKCEYMRNHIGEIYYGTISNVSSFGFFVQLDNIYIDGLVHISTLNNDYYNFDSIGHRLIGKRAGRVYRLGDRLEVIVTAVNIDERKIDFNIPSNQTANQKRVKPD